MNNLEPQHRRGLIIGSIIGALLGAGAAHLIITAPNRDDPELEPLAAGDILSLTAAASVLIRKLIDFSGRT